VTYVRLVAGNCFARRLPGIRIDHRGRVCKGGTR
jgi:hypothetical protein